MLDAASVSEGMQRSRGKALVALSLRGGTVRLDRLEQAGSARAMLPRVHHPVPEVVFLNTSGGLTDGDVLAYETDVGAGARVTATTQTAERAYAAATGTAATVRVRARVGTGGRLDWLPQETILYEGARIDRRTELDLGADAAVLMVECVILGRVAMGERPARPHLTDARIVRRLGRPVWAETLRLDPAVLAAAEGAALLGGARAIAVMAFIAPAAADCAGPLRAALDEPGVSGAVTAMEGRCILRLLAQDAWPLRRQVARLAGILRPGMALPRVWQI